MIDGAWLTDRCQWVAGAWALTYVVHSTILLGSTWLITRLPLIRSDGLKEALWKFALLGGLVSATVQVSAGITPWGGRFMLAETPRAHGTESDPGAGSALPHLPDLSENPEKDFPLPASTLDGAKNADAPITAMEAREECLEGGAPASIPAIPVDGGREKPLPWPSLLLGTCALLAVLGMALLAAAWMRLRSRLSIRVEIKHGPLPALVEKIRRRAGLRKPVRLTCSKRFSVPMAMGIRQPEICLPEKALWNLSRPEQESMLAHEVAHLKRQDPAWLYLTRILENLFIFQPMNRLGSRQWLEAAEYRCDAMAVELSGASLPLARCLTEVAGWIVGSPPAWESATVHGMVRKGSTLSHRITRLLSAPKPAEPGRFRAWRFLLLPALLFAAILAAPGFSVVPPQEEKPSNDSPSPLMEEHRDSEPISLLQALEFLDGEVLALEKEAKALRTELAESGLHGTAGVWIEPMETRMKALNIKRQRIKALIPLVATRSKNGDEPFSREDREK